MSESILSDHNSDHNLLSFSKSKPSSILPKRGTAGALSLDKPHGSFFSNQQTWMDVSKRIHEKLQMPSLLLDRHDLFTKTPEETYEYVK